MIRTKRVLMFIVIAVLMAMTLFTFVQFETVFADTNPSAPVAEEVNDEKSPRVFTSLSISLNGGDGKVWTTVKNDFTLFPSTVYVVVQLYCSDTYQEDYRNMTLVSSNSITDLDMGKTITAEASTNGKQQYWIGRMRYKIGGGDWEERIAGPAKYSASGDFISLD